jgi:hypothetical protein
MTLWSHDENLFDAMRPGNGAEVSRLISNGSDVNAKTARGVTVIQHAALAYMSQIGLAGNLTEKAQQLRKEWASTIDALITTHCTPLSSYRPPPSPWDSRSP